MTADSTSPEAEAANSALAPWPWCVEGPADRPLFGVIATTAATDAQDFAELIAQHAVKELIVALQPFGERDVKFYDEKSKRIQDPSDLVAATTIYLTNQRRAFGEPLLGTVKARLQVRIRGVPRLMTALTLHYPGGSYRFTDQYSIFACSDRVASLAEAVAEIS